MKSKSLLKQLRLLRSIALACIFPIAACADGGVADSTIRLNYHLSTAAIQTAITDQVNKSLPLTEDCRSSVPKSHRCSYTVKRNGDVRVDAQDGTIAVVVPLSLSGRLKMLGKWGPKMSLRGGQMELLIDVKPNIDDQWAVSLSPTIHYTWKEKPYFRILGTKISVAGLVDRPIQRFLAKATDDLTTQVNQVELRPAIQKAANDVFGPHESGNGLYHQFDISGVSFSPIVGNDNYIDGAVELNGVVVATDRPKTDKFTDVVPTAWRSQKGLTSVLKLSADIDADALSNRIRTELDEYLDTGVALSFWGFKPQLNSFELVESDSGLVVKMRAQYCHHWFGCHRWFGQAQGEIKITPSLNGREVAVDVMTVNADFGAGVEGRIMQIIANATGDTFASGREQIALEGLLSKLETDKEFKNALGRVTVTKSHTVLESVAIERGRLALRAKWDGQIDLWVTGGH